MGAPSGAGLRPAGRLDDQQWYYNGDCDQEMISVTSVVARGRDTIVTLSDGRVFGPGALSHLHVWYLVPASDGTYLGAGVAAAAEDLVNIALTSEDPVSPFGPVWPAAR